MKGVILAKNVVRGKNLVGFEDGSVQLISDLTPVDQSVEFDYLQLPPRHMKDQEVVVIRKIGPYQEGEGRITLKRFRGPQGFEFVGAYDTAEQIWAYVTNSFKPIPVLALTH